MVCCFCCCCCLVLFLVCSPLQICRVSILSHDDLCTPHTWRPNSCQKKLACFKNSQTSGIPARRQSMLNILLPLSQSASQSGLLLPLWKVCLSVTPVAKLFLESSPQTRGALLPSPPFGGGDLAMAELCMHSTHNNTTCFGSALVLSRIWSPC